MSNRAITWALKTELPTTPKFALVVLADLADEANSCYPGQEYVAASIGASVSTAARALKRLEREGYLHREQRRGRDGYRTSDRYFLHVQ
jgi:DNA-binding MarR family transcriptional regulator